MWWTESTQKTLIFVFIAKNTSYFSILLSFPIFWSHHSYYSDDVSDNEERCFTGYFSSHCSGVSNGRYLASTLAAPPSILSTNLSASSFLKASSASKSHSKLNSSFRNRSAWRSISDSVMVPCCHRKKYPNSISFVSCSCTSSASLVTTLLPCATRFVSSHESISRRYIPFIVRYDAIVDHNRCASAAVRTHMSARVCFPSSADLLKLNSDIAMNTASVMSWMPNLTVSMGRRKIFLKGKRASRSPNGMCWYSSICMRRPCCGSSVSRRRVSRGDLLLSPFFGDAGGDGLLLVPAMRTLLATSATPFSRVMAWTCLATRLNLSFSSDLYTTITSLNTGSFTETCEKKPRRYPMCFMTLAKLSRTTTRC
eukprot:PhM_4_TR12836/c0_g1_i1/m.69285